MSSTMAPALLDCAIVSTPYRSTSYLRRMNDPLGQALLDEQRGSRTQKLWTDAPNFAPEEFPVKHLIRSHSEMPELEKVLLKHARGKVLDVGAAAGGHTRYLQEQGFDVTALEVSPGACQYMRDKGVEQVVEADLWDYRPHERFDTVLLIMNGLGLAGTLKRLPEFLLHIKSWLNPGGQILFDSSDVQYLYEFDNKPPDRYYGEFRYRLRYKAILSPWFPWIFVDPESLQKILIEVDLNWSLRLDGEHYDYGGVLTIP